MSTNQLTVKNIFDREGVKTRIQEMLGNKASGFITSVLQITTNNKLLANAEPMSIYNAAMMAAALDLPINQNLGFAWIVPYGQQAQFQIGWKGIVQLAQRTGQYQRINVIEVYENQFKSFNSLTEDLDADFSVDGSGEIVGYVAYFRLNNGFEKTVYWSKQKAEAHGKRFSKTFNSGPWKTDFNEMAKKTVLKQTLSKWGILSIEMQTAQKVDQAIVKDYETEEVEYIDNNTEDQPLQEVKLPELTAEDLELAISSGADIETIKKGYNVSPQMEKALIDAKKAK